MGLPDILKVHFFLIPMVYVLCLVGFCPGILDIWLTKFTCSTFDTQASNAQQPKRTGVILLWAAITCSRKLSQKLSFPVTEVTYVGLELFYPRAKRTGSKSPVPVQRAYNSVGTIFV